MINTKRYIAEAFILATLITGALVIATYLTTHEIKWIETASVYFSFACTWLCTRQVRFNYVLGVISTALLVITFWQAHLFGSMALNIYLVPTVVIGWFMWGKDKNPRPVQHVKVKNLFIYLGFTVLTWAGALWTIKAFGGEMAVLDGWLLVGTVLAQYLLDRKKIENWIVWVIVDIVSVYVYWHAGLYLLAAQFLLFTANAAFAWFQWYKGMKTPETVETVEAEDTEVTGEAPATSALT